MGVNAILKRDNLLPSLTWLFVRYHQAYPENQSILLTPCPEEYQILSKKGKSNQLKRKRPEEAFSETEEEESNSETEVAGEERAAKRQKLVTSSATNQQETPLFPPGYSNNTFSTGSTIITTTKTVSPRSNPTPIPNNMALGNQPQVPSIKFAFEPEFKAFVRMAIDRELHDDFSLAPCFPRALSDLEIFIYELFVFFKDEQNQWCSILKKICGDYGIVESRINDVIPGCLKHILKAEGVDWEKLNIGKLNVSWTESSTNVNLVYSKILGETVTITHDNIIPSVTYLLLGYYKIYLKKSGSVKEKSAAEENQNSELSTRSLNYPQSLNIEIPSPPLNYNHSYNRPPNPSPLSPSPYAPINVSDNGYIVQHNSQVPIPRVAPQQQANVLPNLAHFWNPLQQPFAYPRTNNNNCNTHSSNQLQNNDA